MNNNERNEILMEGVKNNSGLGIVPKLILAGTGIAAGVVGAVLYTRKKKASEEEIVEAEVVEDKKSTKNK